MVFSSLLFCFYFLPLVIGLHFFAKEQYRNYFLLIVSLLFYAYGEPKFVFVLIGSICINYVMALAVVRLKEKKKAKTAKAAFVIVIALNLFILFVFKYLGFFIRVLNQVLHTSINETNIALPIGISFFTFQAISYVADVYMERVDVQKNPLFLALYISFFPQLIAGPIVRYTSIENQIRNRTCTVDKIADGAKRFMIGFIKKVLLANNLALVATETFAADVTLANPLALWLGAVCFSLQIYYDFSGYSDMAIGLGKIFGFEFEENFNYPYISKSITEFWRRWHISLGNWFRDYIYIPLGGSRVPFFRHIFNMLVVWLFTGAWHGANYTFLAWGLLYFVMLCVEKYLIKPEKRTCIVLRVIWQVITLFVINFAWVIFNSVSLKSGIKYCLAMVGYYGQSFCLDGTMIRYFREFGIFIGLGILFSVPVMRMLKRNVENTKCAPLFEICGAVVCGILFLLSVSFLVLGAHNPFIYFNF